MINNDYEEDTWDGGKGGGGSSTFNKEGVWKEGEEVEENLET